MFGNQELFLCKNVDNRKIYVQPCVFFLCLNKSSATRYKKFSVLFISNKFIDELYLQDRRALSCGNIFLNITEESELFGINCIVTGPEIVTYTAAKK